MINCTLVIAGSSLKQGLWIECLRIDAISQSLSYLRLPSPAFFLRTSLLGKFGVICDDENRHPVYPALVLKACSTSIRQYAVSI